MEEERTYICIDLKTFYASVECAARGRDPFTTNLGPIPSAWPYRPP